MNKPLLHRREFDQVETNSTHHYVFFVLFFFPPPRLSPSTPIPPCSFWNLELMTWRFQTWTHRLIAAPHGHLVMLLPGTSAGAHRHIMAPALRAHSSSICMYKRSSTSDCRKLHGHFSTRFGFFLLLVKDKCNNKSETSNLYGGERHLLYKKNRCRKTS